MATSSDLYRKQKELIQAKNDFSKSVNSFILECKKTETKANLIKADCMECGDTNIKSIANGGCVQKIIDSVHKMQEKVSSALTSALADIQNEIDRLGDEAAKLAAQEEAARQAAARKRIALLNTKNNETNKIST